MLPAGLKERIAALLGPRGYLDRPEDLALYEYDGSVDKHRPDLVVFPRTTEDVAAIVQIAQRIPRPVRGPRRRHRPFGRRHPARGRHRDRLRAHEPHPRNRPGKRARRGPARRGQSGYHAGGAGQRLLLRARSLQPARLHHRRQRGRERRRAAHPGLRRHHQPRAGPGTGAARRHRGRDRRQGTRPARLRSHRPADRLGRHHGAGHQDHRAADAQAGDWSRPSWRSTTPTRMPAARWPKSPRAPSRRWPWRCSTA